MNLEALRARCRRGFPPLCAIGMLLFIAACQGDYPQSTFGSTSAIGREVDGLFSLIFWLAVVVFVLVEGVLLYVIFKFRRRPDGEAKIIHGHTGLEIAWTLAPAVILAIIAVPTVSTIWREAAEPPANALEVLVTGHQWWWEFEYPESGVRTANELHLPQGRPVVLRMTSDDVIHSFWAPQLFGKRDVILGRTTQLSFTPDSVGTFLGQCAEFCGLSHANMRLEVVVDAPADFDAWVGQQTAPSVPVDSGAALVARGLEVFRAIREPATNSCIVCHTIDGVSGAAGQLGPSLTHLASRRTIAAGVLENNAENLARWLRDPAEVKPGQGILAGDGTVIGMPNVGLTEEEITALVAYLRTLR